VSTQLQLTNISTSISVLTTTVRKSEKMRPQIRKNERNRGEGKTLSQEIIKENVK
jgi:hypothetical protein